MKYINKIFVSMVFLAGVFFTSCETTDLDLLNDPNNLTTNDAELDRLMSNIQLDFNTFLRQMGNNGAQATRLQNPFGRTYRDAFEPVTMDGTWSTAYQGLFSNIQLAETYATALENNKHLGVMKIIKGYTLIVLVDFFGDVPFSEATNPVEFPAPFADPGQDVYQGAIALIDEGVDLLNQPGAELNPDMYYDNDYGKWKKAANTMKLAAYLNTGNTAAFNAIINSGNYIASTADDMQFQYGANQTSPDTRHPSYSNDYTPNGASSYRSNWIMDAMVDNNDPRLRYYFHRQNGCTPGAQGCATDPGRLPCSVTVKPNHYTSDMIYCSVDKGYWGRDHLNAEGIPPDNFFRTVVGVYPHGGLFDDAVIGDETNHPFEGVSSGAGGGGAGINPILLASWVDFWKAEVALASNNTSGAASAMQAGLQKSTSKVASFISVDPTADATVAPTGGQISSFIADIVNQFNSATSMSKKMDILAEQAFITYYGNGIGAYNMYRRTGAPSDLQYSLDPNPGNFVRSFFYPAAEANVNSNIQQKDDLNVQVFWDDNPASPAFPPAN